MSYRKLKIKDKEYQYVIGDTVIKVKMTDGNKIFQKKDIFVGDFNRGITAPAMIRDLILLGELRTPDKYFSTCKCKNVQKHIGCLPFDVEIYGKLHYVYFCEDCFNNNAGDI